MALGMAIAHMYIHPTLCLSLIQQYAKDRSSFHGAALRTPETLRESYDVARLCATPAAAITTTVHGTEDG